MQSECRFLSILFADVEGYSQLDDTQVSQFESICREFQARHLTPRNHCYSNTWGDAIFICSHDPVDAAEIALGLRDSFRNTNWMRMGFPRSLSVRVGLHADRAQVLTDADGTVGNVIGTNVTTTARIEPIVEPGQIYCSQKFINALEGERNLNFRWLRVGARQLAKGFGEMELFRLLREYEADEAQHEEAPTTQPASFSFPKSSVKKDFTEKQMTEVLHESFRTIKDHFRQALADLEQQDADIETSFEEVTSRKFIERIYVRGETRAQCQIWLGSGFGMGESINYNTNRDLSENSLNESLSAEQDGFTIYLRPLLNLGHTQQARLESPEEAAEYLWAAFTNYLRQ